MTIKLPNISTLLVHRSNTKSLLLWNFSKPKQQTTIRSDHRRSFAHSVWYLKQRASNIHPESSQYHHAKQIYHLKEVNFILAYMKNLMHATSVKKVTTPLLRLRDTLPINYTLLLHQEPISTTRDLSLSP